MTDKQIIERLKTDLDFERTKRKTLQAELKCKEQECEELKAEIKLSKEMLIQNTSETNKYTIPQIIEQFISDNYIDQQNDDGYTIPVFIQIENILDIKETLEQELDQLKAENKELKEEFEELKEENEYNEANAIEFKQTLTEIKEIIHFNKTNRLSGGADISIEQILQKISECEAE